MIISFFKCLLELGYKAIAAAIFGILLLLAFMLTAPMGHDAYWGLYRYDYLLIYAICIQLFLVYFKLESWAEVKIIAVFHVLAVIMEVFLTHPSIASWQYPQPAHFKLCTVPLFAGFMYSAVGSFFSRSLRLFQVAFVNLPHFKWMFLLAISSYLNFMTKFFLPDLRYLLFLGSIVLFYKTRVLFQIQQRQLSLPMLIVLLILALLIWIAENISTFYQIWLYPSQLQAWHMVSWAKLGSWYLLLLLSLVLVLKILGKNQRGRWQLNR